jgi:hypothetical protein
MIPLGRAQPTGFEKLLVDLDRRLMAQSLRLPRSRIRPS